jgi:hypothetical protein
MKTFRAIPFLSPVPSRITFARIASIILMACGGMTLQAQDSSLDHAPGVNSTSLAGTNVDASTSAPTGAAPTPAPPMPSLPEQLAIVAQQAALPSTTPALKVSGNHLVTAEGKAVWLQGVNVPMLGWSATGENKVRLPVSDKLWFGQGNPTAADAYRKLVDDSVAIAGAHGAYIILDLHRFLTPDQSCIDFWKDAAARYKNNPAVLFDIFNEPHDTTWDVWRNGGSVPMKGNQPPIPSVGMQALVDTVRGTGAMNIIVAGGLGYAYDLSGVLNGFALEDQGGNGIMYATHFYNWHKGWAEHILGVAAKYPVLVGETGADIHKMKFIPANDQEDPYTWAPDALGFIQKNHLNWTAWSFHPKATPDLILDWTYTPTPYWGALVKEALAGKQFAMTHMR